MKQGWLDDVQTGGSILRIRGKTRMMLETGIGLLLTGTSFLIVLLILVSLGGRGERKRHGELPGM